MLQLGFLDRQYNSRDAQQPPQSGNRYCAAEEAPGRSALGTRASAVPLRGPGSRGAASVKHHTGVF